MPCLPWPLQKRPGFVPAVAGNGGANKAAGADDNSTGGRGQQGKKTGHEKKEAAEEGGPGGVYVFPCYGHATIGPRAMNKRQRRDEKGRGRDDIGQQGARGPGERARRAGRRNVS